MKLKLVVLLSLAILAFAQGATSQFLFPGVAFPRSDLAFLLPATLLVFFWYRLDATERAYRRSAWLNVGVVAVALIALPYYFFRTRGFAKGLLATFVFLGCAVLWSLLVQAGTYATYYGVQA